MLVGQLICLAVISFCPIIVQAENVDDAQALLATFNSSYFNAPTCLELGSSCQTDDYMIAGVESFEPNSPNTVDNCTDNSAAVYQQDEYINRILVRSKDGGPMTAGNSLQIHVTVALASDVSTRSKTDAKETVHIYYASDSHVGSHPVGVDGSHHFGNSHWKWICTKMTDPEVDFMAVLSCDFQIPEGNMDTNCDDSFCGIQAVRVNYGYGEYALEACTETPLWGTPYSDVDDLVFRLAPAPSPPSAAPSQSPSISVSQSTSPSRVEEPIPTTLPAASNYRFVCAATASDISSQCLDHPLCPSGTECEDGSSCFPVHCTECTDVPCIDDPTLSPTDQTGPPSLSSNLPTMAPTIALSTYDMFLPTNEAFRGSFSWAFVAFRVIMLGL